VTSPIMAHSPVSAMAGMEAIEAMQGTEWMGSSALARMLASNGEAADPLGLGSTVCGFEYRVMHKTSEGLLSGILLFSNKAADTLAITPINW
jgi:hypothetical protein